MFLCATFLSLVKKSVRNEFQPANWRAVCFAHTSSEFLFICTKNFKFFWRVEFLSSTKVSSSHTFVSFDGVPLAWFSRSIWAGDHSRDKSLNFKLANDQELFWTVDTLGEMHSKFFHSVPDIQNIKISWKYDVFRLLNAQNLAQACLIGTVPVFAQYFVTLHTHHVCPKSRL